MDSSFFVQKLKDVEEVKKYIGDKAGVIAKIEKPSALKELNEIIEACDGIMVARGDLGVELAPEEVPGYKRKLFLMQTSRQTSYCCYPKARIYD